MSSSILNDDDADNIHSRFLKDMNENNDPELIANERIVSSLSSQSYSRGINASLSTVEEIYSSIKPWWIRFFLKLCASALLEDIKIENMTEFKKIYLDTAVALEVFFFLNISI